VYIQSGADGHYGDGDSDGDGDGDGTESTQSSRSVGYVNVSIKASTDYGYQQVQIPGLVLGLVPTRNWTIAMDLHTKPVLRGCFTLSNYTQQVSTRYTAIDPILQVGS